MGGKKWREIFAKEREKCQDFLDFSMTVAVPKGLTDTADRLGYKDKERVSYSFSKTLKHAGIWVRCRLHQSSCVDRVSSIFQVLFWGWFWQFRDV